MGKSNTSKKVSAQVMRKFVREKLMWRRICIVTAAMFIGSIFVAGPEMEKHAWLPITTLIIYAASMITFRIKSQCPYCGKPIMGNFKKRAHCPFCRRPIQESTGSKESQVLMRKR